METEYSRRNRSEYFKAHYQKNKAKKDAYAKEYSIKYPEKYKLAMSVSGKKNFQKNKTEIYKKRNERYKKDPHTKIRLLLHGRLKSAVKKGLKDESSRKLLGCTIPEFKLYLESKFKDGMSWDNHGKFGWHIDHIKPCALFDLTDPEQQKICFHYTNTQPLWAKENHTKNAKYDGK